MPELSLTPSQLLSAVAVLLLLFVSGGVIYLSTIEWRDRRRRKALDSVGPSGGRSGTGRSTRKQSSSSQAVSSRRRP